MPGKTYIEAGILTQQRSMPQPIWRLFVLSICLLIGPSASAVAAFLQVAPVSLEFPPGTKAAQLTLENLGDTPIDVQARVFRWTQIDGEEQLTPSEDLVVSPPAASLVPGQTYVVRLVRVSGEPVLGEEAYRLLVDELPRVSDDPASKVNFIVRYSIPVFIAHGTNSSQLTWMAAFTDDHLRLTARNDGDRHIRIAGLKVEGPSGISISYGDGLAGYVLAHSTMRWTVPATDMARGATLKITAQGDNGPVSATAVLGTAGE